MSELSPRRRKVVLLCASVACMSGVVPMLMRTHPKLGFAWLGLMVVALIFAVAEFAKWQRGNR